MYYATKVSDDRVYQPAAENRYPLREAQRRTVKDGPKNLFYCVSFNAVGNEHHPCGAVRVRPGCQFDRQGCNMLDDMDDLWLVWRLGDAYDAFCPQQALSRLTILTDTTQLDGGLLQSEPGFFRQCFQAPGQCRIVDFRDVAAPLADHEHRLAMI